MRKDRIVFGRHESWRKRTRTTSANADAAWSLTKTVCLLLLLCAEPTPKHALKFCGALSHRFQHTLLLFLCTHLLRDLNTTQHLSEMTSTHGGSLPSTAFRKDSVKIPSQTRNWNLDAWRYFPSGSGFKSRSAQPWPVIVMSVLVRSSLES